MYRRKADYRRQKIEAKQQAREEKRQDRREEKQKQRSERRDAKQSRKNTKKHKNMRVTEDCQSPSMKCFEHSNDHWKTAPLWNCKCLF